MENTVLKSANMHCVLANARYIFFCFHISFAAACRMEPMHLPQWASQHLNITGMTSHRRVYRPILADRIAALEAAASADTRVARSIVALKQLCFRWAAKRKAEKTQLQVLNRDNKKALKCVNYVTSRYSIISNGGLLQQRDIWHPLF